MDRWSVDVGRAGRHTLARLGVMVLMFVNFLGCAQMTTSTSPTNQQDIILATTTSTQDSGLLDVLVPLFEKQTGYRVKVIAVGTGAALRMGERGDADVLLVHAPEAEEAFMAAGHGVDRQFVMYNDFVIVGPPSDPAGIRGLTDAVMAMQRVAETEGLWISRGDDSGTHKKEMSLWAEARLTPQGAWYQESGQGMGATLLIASEKQAYTLTDRGTYLRLRASLALDILVEGDPRLYNVYHVIVVNPAKHPQVNVEGARAFADFLTSPQVQDIIRSYGVDEFGQPLFHVGR